MTSLSIIIVTHNRIEMLKALLSCLSKSDATLQVIVINNSNDPIKLDDRNIKVVNSKHSTPGEARNTGLKHAQSEWVLFLDDDVMLPKNYLKQGLSLIESYDKNLDIIGGPDQTPIDASFFQECLGLSLKSPMTTARTRYRHSLEDKKIVPGDEKNLILCHLWVKKSFLDKAQIKFNAHFFRNEENILITEAIKKGAVALYRSDLFVYHHRKSNLLALAKSTFSSGKFRAKSFFYSSALFDPLFLVPSLWVIYLVSIPFILYRVPFALAPLIAYVALTTFFSLKIAKGRPLKGVFIVGYQIFINLIYGLGVLYGLTLDRLNIRSRFSL